MTVSMEQWTSHLGIILLASNLKPVASGFAFASHKDVVTCAHVLAGAQIVFHETNLLFATQEPMPRKLKLKYVLPRYDLAVFSVTPEIKGSPFRVGDFKKVRPGDQIFYLGFDQRASATHLTTQINSATVTAIGSVLNDGATVDFLEFEGVGIQGYSGGPVFNTNGELVAVMREAWTRKGIGGGPEVLVNRAFSLEILSVLDGQVFSGIISNSVSTNKSGMALLDILDVPKIIESKTNGPAKSD